MNKHFLIFLSVATIIFFSCKKEVSLKNVQNQEELDSLIIENIKIPFDNYDTVFICKPFFETGGTILTEEQLEQRNRRYDIKFDTSTYFAIFQHRLHKPIIKWTKKNKNKFDSIIKNRLIKNLSSDSLYRINREKNDSVFYSKKVFLSFSSNIISNDTIQLSEFYRNSRNVVELNKIYVYKKKWDLNSIKIKNLRYGWFYPAIDY